MTTKADIKLLCEDDPQLQWWSMVLYAEMSEYFHSLKHMCGDKWSQQDLVQLKQHVQYKVDEFDRIVVQNHLNNAKEREKECLEQQTTDKSAENTTESSPKVENPTGT